MKKKLTLWILLLPIVAFTQTTYNKDGSLTIGLPKQKEKTPDTVQKEKYVYPSDEEEAQEESPKQRRERKKEESSRNPNQEDFNFKRDGLIKGLFHAGINACQIDGDNESGYKYLGANVGAGVMFRFHKNVSVSIGFDYSMKGAKARIVPNPNPLSAQLYRAQLDYIDVPVALNIHDKKLIMFSIGLCPSVLVRYKERDYNGNDVSVNPPDGQPNKFDLGGFAGFHFVIKQNFLLGGKFSYSFTKIRASLLGTKVNGQYNNYLTFQFMYILDSIKKKK